MMEGTKFDQWSHFTDFQLQALCSLDEKKMSLDFRFSFNINWSKSNEWKQFWGFDQKREISSKKFRITNENPAIIICSNFEEFMLQIEIFFYFLERWIHFRIMLIFQVPFKILNCMEFLLAAFKYYKKLALQTLELFST
jgi:hypothetical protein